MKTLECKDFKAYIEQKRKMTHKKIITEICLLINNCADCYNEEVKKTVCCPLNCVELFKVTEKSFYIEPYDNKTNIKLIDIAEQYGYKLGFIMEENEIKSIKFWKE